MSLSLIGEDYLERDIAIALCSLMLNESATNAVNSAEMGKGKRNILEMGALGALNSLARSDQDELQVGSLALPPCHSELVSCPVRASLSSLPCVHFLFPVAFVFHFHIPLCRPHFFSCLMSSKHLDFLGGFFRCLCHPNLTTAVHIVCIVHLPPLCSCWSSDQGR